MFYLNIIIWYFVGSPDPKIVSSTVTGWGLVSLYTYPTNRSFYGTLASRMESQMNAFREEGNWVTAHKCAVLAAWAKFFMNDVGGIDCVFWCFKDR